MAFITMSRSTEGGASTVLEGGWPENWPQLRLRSNIKRFSSLPASLAQIVEKKIPLPRLSQRALKGLEI